jgi:N-acetylmuramoyl-L-alanine amidase
VTHSSRAVTPPANRPVIVVDPGHSPTITATDPATGLNVSDYANEPEMHDVFAVAELVKAQLQAAGYRVIMTKASATQPTSLGQRATIANNAHAALALSIHDQAGSNGGIGFDQGNSVVYYQSVGDYRETPSGKKVVFTDSAVAALSKKYGQIFRAQRAKAQGQPIALQSNVGYDLGTRGLPAGNIWIVQLLAHVPWIYNEAGGNSPGMSGLNATDMHTYADGLVAAVERCVPVPH